MSVRHAPIFDDRRIAKDRRAFWKHKAEHAAPEDRRVFDRREETYVSLVLILGRDPVTGGIWV